MRVVDFNDTDFKELGKQHIRSLRIGDEKEQIMLGIVDRIEAVEAGGKTREELLEECIAGIMYAFKYRHYPEHVISAVAGELYQLQEKIK